MRKLLLLPLLCLLSAAHSPAPPSRPGGKDYALFFAIEQYDNTSAWPKLPGLTKEVESIASDLRDLYGYEECKVLKNPTLAEIDAELARWRARSFGPDDQLFVFFSGHGQYVDDRKQGYFIPRDGLGSTGSIYERKWLPYLDLRRLVTGIPCRHILLALDACFSGTADDEVIFKDETEEWAEPTGAQDRQWNQQIHDQLRCQSRILLTSGGKTKTENPSKFAASFRKAFSKQGGPDKIVRPSDIREEWYGLPIQPHASTFEGHDACGNFLFVYQHKTPITPPIVAVPDYDDDGIPDAEDKCPTEKGPRSTKGCPDTDGDGVADKFDDCPYEKGYLMYEGCLSSAKSVGVTPASRAALDNLIKNRKSGLIMKAVNGGTFTMGSREDVFLESECPHRVSVKSFKIGYYEVTQADWRAVMGSDPLELKFKSCDDCPVEGVSWDDIQEFLTRLNEKTGLSYRLPREAEWEYAARGARLSKGYSYSGSNTLNDVAWNSNNSDLRTHPVGDMQANELSLFDMSGNVSEWCQDIYNEYPCLKKDKKKNYNDQRAIRGGSWKTVDNYSSTRGSSAPSYRNDTVGFRLAQD